MMPDWQAHNRTFQRDISLSGISITDQNNAYASAEKMRSFLRNIPENHAEKVDFPMISEGSPRCETCPYRRSCDRE